jgi:predicted ABC-type ATPase
MKTASKKDSQAPKLYIIAGPNGAGKTTFATHFLPNSENCLEFVNADLVAQGLSPLAPQSAVMAAGRIFLQRLQELARLKSDFAFETTLAGKAYEPFLKDLKHQGYAIHLIYLWLNSEKLALARVAFRVKQGGHSVARHEVIRRYGQGLYQFFHLYQPLADTWTLFDNSDRKPELIAYHIEAEYIEKPEIYARIIKRAEREKKRHS